MASMDCLISRTPVEKTRMSPPVSAEVSRQWATCCTVACEQSASVSRYWKRPHRCADKTKVDLLGPRGDLERLQSPHVRLGHTARDKGAAHAIELRLRCFARWLSARPVGIFREQGRQVRLEVKVLNGVCEAAQRGVDELENDSGRVCREEPQLTRGFRCKGRLRNSPKIAAG